LNLNFSPSITILFFAFIDIRRFFPSLKLHYCRTIVLLNKLKLLKKSDDGHAISRQEKRRLPEKHNAISRQEKMTFSTPCRVVWGSPLPPPDSVRAGRVR